MVALKMEVQMEDDEESAGVSLEARVAFLEEALAHTQDRLMAAEAAVRVLMCSLDRTGAVPAYQLLWDFQNSAHQLHRLEEFPQALRALNLFRAFAQSLETDAPEP